VEREGAPSGWRGEPSVWEKAATSPQTPTTYAICGRDEVDRGCHLSRGRLPTL
jgi:hypothetical protein